jgi:ABC-2 type transport system ATP-binding protein
MLIDVGGLRKRFGNREVLAGVDLRVEPGEVVGLAGINGAGKTTVIHLLMGFLEPDAGELIVLGRDPATRDHLGQVGWLPERPAFPPRLRVGDLLAMQRQAQPSWDAAFAGVLRERLAVESAARVSALSRGELGRLALLLALPARPRLLLLDDPTLGLDPAGRRLLLGELLATAAEGGAGILLSTHLLDEVGHSLDRLAILHQGRLVVDEPVEALSRDWRRIWAPPGGAGPPAILDPLRTADGWLCRRWDPAEWDGEAQPATLEEIFLAVTGGDR